MSNQSHVSQYRIYSTNPSPEFMDRLALLPQVIFSDGGPWCQHNVVCAICGNRTAVMDLNLGVFLPCWDCQKSGWKLTLKKKRSWRFWKR